MDFIDCLCKVLDAVGRQWNISINSVTNWLANIEGLEKSQLVCVFTDQIGELQKNPLTCFGTQAGPAPIFKSLSGGFHRSVHIGPVAGSYSREDLTRNRTNA